MLCDAEQEDLKEEENLKWKLFKNSNHRREEKGM